jgi:hypothetical protein
VTLADWQLGDLANTGELVTSELVTNALEASTAPGGGPAYVGGRMAVIGLRLHANRSRLLVEVYDQAPGKPVARHAANDAESGRGLAIVHRLTGGRWGWHTVQGQPGKVVWAEIQALLVGSPRASQPWAPTEPCVTVSRYTALIILAIREIRSRPSGRRTEDTAW